MAGSVGPFKARRLVKIFGSARRVVSASRQRLLSVPGIGEVAATEIVRLRSDRTSTATARRQISRAAALNASGCTPQFEEYPSLLRELYDRPPILWSIGAFRPGSSKSVAVVGTRRPSGYGINIADVLSAQLAARGVTIVSGLASGIDTAAHQGALRAGGKTIAVLGNGLDRIYPASNAKLADQICESGSLVSELSFGTLPNAKNFPMRNRIISGLCPAVVVVEAFESGGALITARLAQEQNREVFAVPSPLGRPSGVGSNTLIARGHARLLLNVDELAEELALSYPEFAKASPSGIDKAGLGPIQLRILEALETEPIHLTRLADELQLPVMQVLQALTGLECRDYVKSFPGKLFALRRVSN